MSPIQHLQTPQNGNIINNLSRSNLIMFAKLAGRQEIRLKLKQGESVSGPKVKVKELKLSNIYYIYLKYKK